MARPAASEPDRPASARGHQGLLALAGVPQANKAPIRLQGVDNRRVAAPVDGQDICFQRALAVIDAAANVPVDTIAAGFLGDLDAPDISAAIRVLPVYFVGAADPRKIESLGKQAEVF